MLTANRGLDGFIFRAIQALHRAIDEANEPEAVLETLTSLTRHHLVDVNQRNLAGSSAFDLAVEYLLPSVAELLLAQGARASRGFDISALRKKRKVKEFFEVSCQDDFQIGEFLAENPDIDVNITNGAGETALMTAAAHNEVPTILILPCSCNER